MPKKTFTAGEVLSASDVNTFLMDQSVMTFADSAARGSAIPSPTEGMVTYLDDTDAFEYWDGSAFTSLVSSSGAATNAIINGAFEINQRNFTSNTTNGYGFDRWVNFASGGTVTQSSQAFTLGAAPITGFESTNFYRNLVSGQSASNHLSVLIQPIESVRSFAGQTITVSFYAKAGSGTPKIGIELSQEFGTGGSPSSIVSTSTTAPTISTSWVRYSATVNVPSISGKTIGTNGDDSLKLILWFSGGTDFNARSGSIGIQNNTFDIWGVQLEAGSTATPFRRNANSLQGELAACQRYYIRNTATGNFATLLGTGSAATSTLAVLTFDGASLRAEPTSVEFGNCGLDDGASSIVAVTSMTLGGGIVGTVRPAVSSGLTAFRPYRLIANNNSSAFVGISAEL
jgi:hypothetical protein